MRHARGYPRYDVLQQGEHVLRGLVGDGQHGGGRLR